MVSLLGTTLASTWASGRLDPHLAETRALFVLVMVIIMISFTVTLPTNYTS
jgi:hypothetical protein